MEILLVDGVRWCFDTWYGMRCPWCGNPTGHFYEDWDRRGPQDRVIIFTPPCGAVDKRSGRSRFTALRIREEKP